MQNNLCKIAIDTFKQKLIDRWIMTIESHIVKLAGSHSWGTLYTLNGFLVLNLKENNNHTTSFIVLIWKIIINSSIFYAIIWVMYKSILQNIVS